MRLSSGLSAPSCGALSTSLASLSLGPPSHKMKTWREIKISSSSQMPLSLISYTPFTGKTQLEDDTA